MFEDFQEDVKCTVTKELIVEVAERYRDVFFTTDEFGEGFDVHEVLFALGFDNQNNYKNRNVNISHKVWVRHPKVGYQAFQTDLYTGSVRKEVESIEGGTIIYKDTLHPLAKMYETYEVVHCSDIDIVGKVLEHTLNIGDPHAV